MTNRKSNFDRRQFLKKAGLGLGVSTLATTAYPFATYTDWSPISDEEKFCSNGRSAIYQHRVSFIVHISVLENGYIGEKSEKHGGEFGFTVIRRDIVCVREQRETGMRKL